MAPLSVQRAIGGAYTGARERRLSSARKGPLAATPPERRTQRAPAAAAARTVFVTRTSTTASWKPAAISGMPAVLSVATRAIALLRPLKLKSLDEGPSQARGRRG